MNTPEIKGKEIASRFKIQKQGKKWIVPSQTGNGKYTVDLDGEMPHCTCPDYELRGLKCKHIYAVEYTITHETDQENHTTTVTKTVESRTNRIGLPTMQHRPMRKPTFNRCSMICAS